MSSFSCSDDEEVDLNEDESDNKNIYTPKMLNDILLTKTKITAYNYKNIIMIGDLISIHMWKRGGMSFKISNCNNIFECKVWTKDGLDIDEITSYENKKCKIVGDIEAEFFYTHKFNLRVKNISVIGTDSKINQLKKICNDRGYFINKKNIEWDKIKKIGIISKKNTQGYNDFIKQFGVPIPITLEEISLEGANTSKESIEAINKLQKMDIIIFIRGGGSTVDISNSYDKIELYDAIKQSKIPIITAIGHEHDKGDNLLITQISDLDYSTPSTASYEMRKIILKPFIYKINELMDKIEISFEKQYDKDKAKEYNKLKCLLTQFIKEIFGGPIVSVSDDEKYVIIQKDNIFYKNNIKLDESINLTKNELEYRHNIIKGIDAHDIGAINRNFNKFDSYNKVLSENIKDSIKKIKDIEKVEIKFENIKPKKLKNMYCKKMPSIEKSDMKTINDLKKTILYYIKVLDELINENEIKEVLDFIILI